MFKVCLVGRPNVGKSTLFNFLIGKKIAIVDSNPGVTRDRKEFKASLFDIDMNLIDTGGYDDISDTMNEKIWQQSKQAISSANCILFVVDGKFGISPIDKELAIFLRETNIPVIVCISKSDTSEAKKNQSLFYELGFEDIVNVSAVHGIGMADLYHYVKPYYDDFILSNTSTKDDDKPQLSITFVGKPNVGKSTIINTLLNEDRLITNDAAGTTRDSIYLDFIYNNQKIKLVDTAGLRKRSSVDTKLEKMSNSDTITSINFATVAILIISAEEGLTKQDLIIAKHIVEEGRGLIIVVNKIDLIEKPKTFLNDVKYKIEQAFFQVKKPYIIGISALKDKNINAIIDAVLELYKKWQFVINTSKLNRWLELIKKENYPPSINGRKLKVKFANQVKTRPPTINIWSNYDKEFPDSYLRYIQNEFIKSFDLWGCTVRFNIKKSENPYQDKPRKTNREKQVKQNKERRLKKKNRVL